MGITSQPTVNYQVYETNRYEFFSLAESNRSIDESHVKVIKESMEKHGFLSHQHIIVDMEGTIIDGQHRYEAARRIGSKIYYSVYERKYNLDMVLDLNMRKETWGLVDFVDSFISQGRDDYKEYKDFYEEYDIPPSVPAYMIKTTTTRVKNGDLEWPSDDELLHDAARLISHAREEARPGIVHRKQFILAVMDLLEKKPKIEASELGKKFPIQQKEVILLQRHQREII